MQRIFGYCRISRPTQNIERQERNIIKEYPTAWIYKEAYTGTKVQGRKALEKILKQARKGDVIVFDSVSRMSRNADEGIKLYMQLYDRGIDLVFLKEPHINTETYKQALTNDIPLTGEDIDLILQGVNAYLKKLAMRQIELAFIQAQKEVDDLHQRTAEGIETARRNGKQIGQRSGAKLNVKKAVNAKKIIRTSCKTFGGTLTDEQCASLTGVSRKSYYKYKSELRFEIISEELGKVPFLNADNCKSVLPYESDCESEEYFNELQYCVDFLEEKYGDEISGMWFIRIPPAIIIRIEKQSEILKNRLISDISNFTGQEKIYIITNENVDELRGNSIYKQLAEGEILAIFDAERKQDG